MISTFNNMVIFYLFQALLLRRLAYTRSFLHLMLICLHLNCAERRLFSNFFQRVVIRLWSCSVVVRSTHPPDFTCFIHPIPRALTHHTTLHHTTPHTTLHHTTPHTVVFYGSHAMLCNQDNIYLLPRCFAASAYITSPFLIINLLI